MRKVKLIQHGIFVTLMLLSLTSTETLGQSKCISGDCQNGHGIMKFSKNSQFVGWFKNGLRDGYGYMKYNNGDTYVGEWSENLRHGHGVHNYYDHPVRTRFAGEWKNNNIEGYGTMHKKKGGFETGYWNKNQFSPIQESRQCMDGNCQNGWGAYIANDGGFYLGNFKNGKPHGQGTAIYKMGTKYKGSFVNGKREGQGTYYQLGGNKYVGGWKAGKKDGEGYMFSKGKLTAVVQFYRNTITKKTIPSVEQIQKIGKAKEDRTAPQITILSPKVKDRGVGIVSKAKKIRIHGTVRDLSGVRTIRVGGVKASILDKDDDSKLVSFEAYISLSKGQNQFWVEATDVRGNVGKVDFKVKHEPFDNGSSDEDKPDLIAVKDKYKKRKALVIGNNAYSNAPLVNPVNDANAVSARLVDFGFDVEVVLNGSLKKMERSIENFVASLDDETIGLFYYAGHGVQVDGSNYIIPVDAKIEKERDVKYESVNVQRFLENIGTAKNPLNIVILDACRDNPFAKNPDYAERGRGFNSNGLAPITHAPTGTFMAYSTSPGQTASDGEGSNGLYTEQLLKAFNNCKGLKLESFFKLVRAGVHKSSEGAQLPWDHSSILIDFYFDR